MIIRRFTGPPVDTHTYLVGDAASGEAWAVDAPLETYDRVVRAAAESNLRLTGLILTHAHFDHFLDIQRYQDVGIPVVGHPLGRQLLEAPQPALFGFPMRMPRVEISREVEEGDVLTLGDTTWTVWHTPGHAPGHIILYSVDHETVLGGDMLFKNGFGRVDLPFCDPEAMRASLKRMVALPRETRVYPGHGPHTTIGEERTWLKELLDRPLL